MWFRFAKLPTWRWSLITTAGYAAVRVLIAVIADELTWSSVLVYTPSVLIVGLAMGPAYARTSR
jgi:hypothetical protein